MCRNAPEKRRRRHLRLAASISQGAIPIKECITDCNVYPGVEGLTVKVEKYAVRQGQYLYLKLPGLIKGIKGIHKEKRINPL